jgi:hypothetical protein
MAMLALLHKSEPIAAMDLHSRKAGGQYSATKQRKVRAKKKEKVRHVYITSPASI